MNAIIVKVGEGQARSLGTIRMLVKEDGSRTRGTLGLAEFEVPPQGQNTPPPHVHRAHEEGFYVLEGELEFQVGTEKVRAHQGDFVMVPIGAAHTFSNPTDKPARFLNTFTPRRYLDYFEELSQLYQTTAAPVPQQLAEIMSHYNTERINEMNAATSVQPGIRHETFADGLTLRIDERGNGRPMLVLHGGAGPQSVVAFAQAMSSQGVHTLTPTHPGFGGEPRPDWFNSIDDLAVVYLDLLERLDLRDVTVVGFSVGGWIAAEMAVRDVSRLGRIILVDAAGIEVEDQNIPDVFSLTPDQISSLSFHNPAAFRFDPSTLSPEQLAARAANFKALGAYTRQGMIDPKLRRRLGRVKIPALVVWGESDRMIVPDYGRAYAQSLPQARFELIPECGHNPQLEQPERLLKLVEAFA